MKGFIRTAYPLTESQLARLTAVFSSKLHTPSDFQVEHAPELRCGLEVTIGGRIYEYNVKDQLIDAMQLMTT